MKQKVLYLTKSIKYRFVFFSEIMKVVLVWPYGFDPIYTMPLSLGYLKSNTSNSKHDLQLINCSLLKLNAASPEFKKKLRELNPNVVGVSCWSPTYEESLQVLKTAKEINEKIITTMGGVHPTAYPDAIMKHNFVDFVFRGESELSFPIFLEELQKEAPDWSKVKGLVYRSEGSGIVKSAIVKNEMEREKDLDKINFPDYDAMRLQDYINTGYKFHTNYKMNAPVWTTRGCPYRCAYCTAPLQNGKLVRTHSIKYMVEWIKSLYYKEGIRLVNIIDDNFTFNIDYAKEFCKAMISLNLKDLRFGIPSGIRIQRTDVELFHLMKQAGFEYLTIAPESGSAAVLNRMKKDLDLRIIPQKVKEIKEAGLKVHGLFIIGYPGETEEDLKKTVKLIRDCKFNFFFLSNFQPLPGTPVYDELVKSGDIAEGLLPKHYSSGERVYTPKELKNFNFSLFVIRQYVHLAISQPLNIPYMLKVISPKMIVERVYTNVMNMFNHNMENSKEQTFQEEINSSTPLTI